MKQIKTFLLSFFLILTAAWWLTDTPALSSLNNFFAWRNVLMQYSGVLAIAVMSVGMILAIRPVLFEPYLGGLDKMYRLHKWLGISGLVLALSHWLIAQGPKWLVGLGWLERPIRGPRPALPDDPIVQFFSNQRGLAEGIGEWAFYAAALLILLALIKRIAYKHFFKTHHLLAIAYLALVWHSVILLKLDDWSGLLGPIMIALMLAGSVGAVLVLLGRVAKHRQLVGEVVGMHHHQALQVMQVDIAFQGRWAGHEAGQFAFVTLHEDEGAHPYTISSAWKDDGHLSFIIKALGDYTRTLAERIQLKDVVKVEGPYGRFNFEGESQQQIWVGAGIGITPFIARMQAIAKNPDSREVQLFHTTRVYDAHAIGLLESDAKAAKVALTVLSDERDGRLSAARIAEQVPNWQTADIWFCGPAQFGQSLLKDFMTMGLPQARFHQELFEMR